MEEEIPVLSAQNVGREFVRQYYTMLNEAPQFLHRFYSHNSSFVHGGMERPGEESSPAIGQGEIYKKIVSLNFKDCHAKICQVDSQPSVEGAVVIQVVGELSNNGQPMRRFMQTFVLAPQSAKKYYLHNDIFRYQDEVFHDDAEENSPGLGTTAAGPEEYGYAEEDVQQQQSQLPQPLQQLTDETASSVPYYDGGIEQQQQQPHPISNGGATYPGEGEEVELPPTSTTQQQPEAATAEVVEATPAAAAAVAPVQAAATEAVGERVELSSPAAVDVVPGAAEAVVVKPEEDAAAAATVAVSSAADAAAAVVVKPEPVTPAQKPTWAAMASRNTAAVSASSAVVTTGKPQATIKPEPQAEQRFTSPPNGALPQRPPRGGYQQQQQQVDSTAASTAATGASDETAAGSFENGVGRVNEEDVGGGTRGVGGRGQQLSQQQVYPDNQQVFVGNVPHFVTDEELREYFETYGPVADIRINRKANNNVPNYGFVAFEAAETVQKILYALPLPKLHNRHRINVEEKKPREELSRPRSGTRPLPQQGQGGGKMFGRDSYSPRGAGRGGYNNGGTGRGGPPVHNGGGYGGSAGGGGYESRSYTKSCSSDDGRGGGPPPPPPQR